MFAAGPNFRDPGGESRNSPPKGGEFENSPPGSRNLAHNSPPYPVNSAWIVNFNARQFMGARWDLVGRRR